VELSARYRDIAAFHGGRYPAGTALGYKALLLAQEAMFPDRGRFTRGKCSVRTAFTGSGFADAVEAVLRCVSSGMYTADPMMEAPDGTPPAPVIGKFFYRFVQEDGAVELTLKPGLIPDEFYRATEDLHNGKTDSEDGAMKLRLDIERTLMSMNPRDIFDIRSLRPCAASMEEGVPPPLLSDGSRVKISDYGTFETDIDTLRRYHGDEALCGLCLVWTLARQWAARVRPKDGAIPRGSVTVTAGARGKGIDDAFEFLFRVSRGNRLSVNTRWGAEFGAPEVLPGAGRFAFGLSLDGARQDVFALKDELTPREYLRLCKLKSEQRGDFREESALKSTQIEFANLLLATPEPFHRHS
jgi:formylmethanofuran dehydrogenase subunit E